MRNFFINIIVIVFLLLCLLPMPYGYYIFVRYVAMIAFVWMAYKYYQTQKKELAFSFGALAFLFQPFVKIALGRVIWNIVDVFVAVFLLYLLWKEYQTHK